MDEGGAFLLERVRRRRQDPRSGGRPLVPSIPPELERDYEEYRSNQAAAFLRLLPPDGVRPLYGVAREWAKAHGHYDHRAPMTALIAFLKHRLPLPTLEVWAEDQARHPVAHLIAGWTSGGGGAVSTEPLAVRILEARAETWRVGLHVFADESSWKGYMSFRLAGARHRNPSGPSAERRSMYRTADVFAERDPHIIHDIFIAYEPSTLEAFLRSVLP